MFQGEKPPGIFSIAGRTKLEIINEPAAPLEESKLKVMLKLTAGGLGKDRAGVDLVMVLDVSGSVEGEEFARMKREVNFVIKKLSPIDRLSVVTFSSSSTRLCPLQPMNENSQQLTQHLVDDLAGGGGGPSNITAGLQTGLQVLNGRRITSGRAVAIILISRSEENAGHHASEVPIGNVPVFTFGFGRGHDPEVLNAIALSSSGGAYSDVQTTDDLGIALSQCLAQFFTVAVHDLRLTFTPPDESMIIIETVLAGDCPQHTDSADGSVTVSFGDLYDQEQRRVIVDLLLPPVASPQDHVDVLEIHFMYRYKRRLVDGVPVIAFIRRTETPVVQEREEVMIEEEHLQTARMIKEGRGMADLKIAAESSRPHGSSS